MHPGYPSHSPKETGFLSLQIIPMKGRKTTSLQKVQIASKSFLLIYMNKDQILTWLAAESEIKSQLIWIKSLQRSGSADPLLCMHARCRRKAGWTPSNRLRNPIKWGRRCASVTPHTSRWDTQREPTPKGEGAATRGEAKEKKGPFSLLMPLSLTFSSLNLIYLLFAMHP